MNKYQEKKYVIALLILFSIAIALAWVILVWNETRIKKLDIAKLSMINSGEQGYSLNFSEVKNTNDGIATTKDFIEITGSLTKADVPTQKVVIKVVLKDVSSDNYYVLPTQVEHREAENDWAGFISKIPYGGKINLDKTDYEIMAFYQLNDEDEVLVKSGQKLKEFN